MILPPKHQITPPQTSPDLERSRTASAEGQAKRHWTPPRCRRLELGGTDGSKTAFSTIDVTPFGPVIS